MQEKTASWDQSTFEALQNRLNGHTAQLRQALGHLDERRREAFGSTPTELVTTEHIISEHNCVPMDMVSVGHRFIFGFNVRFGLKTEVLLEDVFSIHHWNGETMVPDSLDLIVDDRFLDDFKSLYKYYRHTRFAKFSIIGPYLFMIFQVGQNTSDIKTFKWVIEDGSLSYVDNRSDHEFAYPSQFDFQWTKTTRDSHSKGPHPHVSIDDRVFVETVDGDLTIKIEDNTESGEGIYAEPVTHKEQSLDDAEIFYAILEHLILLKIRPFQEKDFRFFVFNDKLKTVARADGIGDCCLVLPGDAGLVHASGTYSVSGEVRHFENHVRGILFERRIPSPNGEDYFYVFFQPQTSLYVLMMYNTITGEMGAPIQCHGYSLFDDGQLLFFRADDEPQKHHAIQVWQTPFSKHPPKPASNVNPVVAKVGNRDIVRFLAEGHRIIQIVRDFRLHESYFRDLVKMVDEILEGFHWVPQTDLSLHKPLKSLRETAQQAIDVYQKVLDYQRDAQKGLDQVRKDAEKLVSRVAVTKEHLDEHLSFLESLRHVKGNIEGMREKPYMDVSSLDELSRRVTESALIGTGHLIDFLMTDHALASFHLELDELNQALSELEKGAQARVLKQQSHHLTEKLELLLDVLNRLQADDATQVSAIVEKLTLLFQELNRFQSKLQQRIQSFSERENQAAFTAQMTLFQQNMTHMLERAETPELCDANLGRLMLHLEEMETRFADSESFLLVLAERREELVSAFDQRRFSLSEKRQKQAQNLVQASERILDGISRRLSACNTQEEMNSFLAADLMVEKVRANVERLRGLGDEVRAEELLSRFQSLREEALRQLRDRLDLFAAANTIRLGRHQFQVQSSSLELSLVRVRDRWGVQISGTQFLEPVNKEDLEPYRPVWDWDVACETPSLYAGCVLAHHVMNTHAKGDWASRVNDEFPKVVLDGYIKGVHDRDAVQIAEELARMGTHLQTLVHEPHTRGLVRTVWYRMLDDTQRDKLTICAAAFRAVDKQNPPSHLVDVCRETLAPYASFLNGVSGAAMFLAHGLLIDGMHLVAKDSLDLCNRFAESLRVDGLTETFNQSVWSLGDMYQAQWELVMSWLDKYQVQGEWVPEIASMVLCGDQVWTACESDEMVRLSGLLGSHSTIADGCLEVSYRNLVNELERHRSTLRPMYDEFISLKKRIAEDYGNLLKLDRFKPRVLTSFVRNQLIDQVYLPLIGDNLAKQIGAAGDEKRTDLMGLLLLVSPPGYGKTTLMEYTAHRLGLVFVKINGPSIGHAVTSLDPAEAPHASAREELGKLNLALRLGDNVMIYVDDIQHCHPEFLQKFIALCDAQRRMEGVWKGEPVSYDLRGRKVCVVMAGNPYTESGSRFQVPDMLANRADTYNLGEVIGGRQEAFSRSYLENCMTSNKVLARIARSHPKDLHHFIDVAQGATYDAAKVEGDYPAVYVDEVHAVVSKLLFVRDRLLKVNQAYMESAAQSDDYRSEPPFKLQGSYRNMNKIAEKIMAITNEGELDQILADHYENEAQTLASGTEANLLKLYELLGWMDDARKRRWADIKQTFSRNVFLRSSGSDDPAAQVMAQMALLNEGVTRIGKALRQGVRKLKEGPVFPETVESQWSDTQWRQLLDVLRSLAPEEKEVLRMDRETGLPSGFLEKHGFTVQKLGGSLFELRQGQGPLVALNARGTQLHFSVDLGQLADDEQDDLIKRLRALNRKIYPISFKAQSVSDGGHALSLSVSVEKADMNGLKWLAVFDALKTASDYATTILQGKGKTG